MKLQFYQTIEKSQELSNAAQVMSIKIKEECMDLLGDFKARIDLVDRVKSEQGRQNENI